MNIYWDQNIRQIDCACSAALYEYFVALLSRDEMADNSVNKPNIKYFDIEDNQEVVEAVAVKDGDVEYELVLMLDTENDDVVGTSYIAAFTNDKGENGTPMILAQKKYGEYAGFATNMNLDKATEIVTAICKRYINTVSVFTNSTHI